MKIIVFDTETTGTPNAGSTNLEDQPHVCQFAGIIYEINPSSLTFKIDQTIDIMIKPPIAMPKDAEQVHGLSDAMLASAPSFGEVAYKIENAFRSSDLAIAHNAAFDIFLIETEYKRLGKTADFFPIEMLDSMKETKDLCRLPGRNGGYKSPRLMELYKFLFNEEFQNAHNALEDVKALGRCTEKLFQEHILNPDWQKIIDHRKQVPVKEVAAAEQTSLFL